MREAVGGSLLLYLIIPIIILFIVFIGFIMRYASTYRAANYVITQIENCQGDMKCADMVTISKTIKESYGYVDSKEIVSPVCIKNGAGVVYRVDLPVVFDLPLIGGARLISVKAETKTIQNRTCS